MMMMTAKVDIKKVLIALAAAAALILALTMVFGSHEETQPTSSVSAAAAADNDARVEFLTDQGWEIVTSPRESGQVSIPETPTEIYERYNALQKSQGFDLSRFAGKTVMRYVYEIKNFPGATAPVYATLLVYKGKIIGGDITDTSPTGSVRSFRQQAETVPTQPTETTVSE